MDGYTGFGLMAALDPHFAGRIHPSGAIPPPLREPGTLAPPTSPDPMYDVPLHDAPNRTEQFHQENFTDSDMARLEQEMADRNRKIQQEQERLGQEPLSSSAGGSGSASAVAAASAGMSPWIPAGAAAAMALAGLGALGYSASQIQSIADQASALPPGTAIQPPPPDTFSLGSPLTPYYYDPRAFYAFRKKRRMRIRGLLK